MSNRERVNSILDTIPEYKLPYVIDMLNGLKGLLHDYDEDVVVGIDEDGIEVVEPDEWDLAMIAEAEKVNDGATVTLEELMERDGFTYEDLQG